MHDVRGPHGSKVTEPDFLGFRPKTVQNGLKTDFFNII